MKKSGIGTSLTRRLLREVWSATLMEAYSVYGCIWTTRRVYVVLDKDNPPVHIYDTTGMPFQGRNTIGVRVIWEDK